MRLHISAAIANELHAKLGAELDPQIKAKLEGAVSRGVKAAEIDGNGHLLFTLTDNSVVDLGPVVGPQGDPGEPGPAGEPGPQGVPGDDGDDGYSPSVSVAEITGGHRVTITDADGPHVFDVMDGQVAVNSVNGKTGDVELSASDVGALPDTTTIPSALSDLTQDTGHRTVTDAEKAEWNANTEAISDIDALIPEQAAADNQLADKAFVNSTVGTNTAIFRGTFNSVAELEAYAGEKTNNDYAFVIIYNATVPTQVDRYDRYKYNGSSWAFEYSLNNSSFTAVQWAAIQSGITSGLVVLFNNHIVNGTVHVTAEDKTNWNGKGTYSKPGTGIPKSDLASSVQTSLGNADTAYQKPSSGIPKTDLASLVQSSLDKADAIVDYITEEGTSGDWYYRKWSSGRKELWLKTTVNAAMTTQRGNEYITSSSFTEQFPSGFSLSTFVVLGGITADASGATTHPVRTYNTFCSASAISFRLSSTASQTINVDVTAYIFGL